MAAWWPEQRYTRENRETMVGEDAESVFRPFEVCPVEQLELRSTAPHGRVVSLLWPEGRHEGSGAI